MKVAAYQMPVSCCYATDAVARLAERVRQCENAGVSLLCCPEAALGGLADYAETPDDSAIPSERDALGAKLQPLASRSVAVIVGFTERNSSGRYYNAAAVYVDGVVVGIYRKHHPAIRRSRYSPGGHLPVFRVAETVIGILICRDSTDERLAAALVEQGAELLCIPTNNAMPRDRGGPGLVHDVRALDARLAQRVGVPIVRADVVGTARDLISAGSSVITARSGAQVYPTGAKQGELIVAELFDPFN